MTFLEAKLLEYFRSCDETRRNAIFETAKLCLDLSQNPPSGDIDIITLPPTSADDPDNVQTSTHAREIVRLYDSLNDEYKSRLTRYARELNALNRMTGPASASEDLPAPADPAPVQTSAPSVFPVMRMDYDPELMKFQKNRSIISIAKRADGNVPLRYSMSISDIAVLSDLLYEDRTGIKPFGVAFDFGFVMGSRATQRGKVKNL